MVSSSSVEIYTDSTLDYNVHAYIKEKIKPNNVKVYIGSNVKRKAPETNYRGVRR